MKRSLCFQDVISASPEATGDLLRRVAELAEQDGRVLYLVGGPVRDLLLGRPIVDLDLMVEDDPRGLAEAVVRSAGDEVFEVTEHDRFGTLRIRSPEAHVDIARMRSERYPQPGALPEVDRGDLEQDVARRDFSVNALLCVLRPSQPARGQEVIDLAGGLTDLARRRLRVLHVRSFHDDPTRAWRAARLAVRLGFRIERGSRSALRDALRDGAFGAVSGERFRRELQRVFAEAERGVHPGRILRLLADWHVLSALEPGLGLERRSMVPLRRLGLAIAEPDWPAPRWRPWVSGLAIWLAPFRAALRRRTLERFSIRGEQATRIVGFGRDVDRWLKALGSTRGRGAVDALLAELPEEIVQALYASADARVRRRILRWGAEDRRRRSPVGGGDLKALGLSGPEIGRTLARIRAGFLDGDVANREEALALAEELARRATRRPRRTRAARRRSGDSRRRKTEPAKSDVAREDPIADTSEDRRTTSSSPDTASPQAGPTR